MAVAPTNNRANMDIGFSLKYLAIRRAISSSSLSVVLPWCSCSSISLPKILGRMRNIDDPIPINARPRNILPLWGFASLNIGNKVIGKKKVWMPKYPLQIVPGSIPKFCRGSFRVNRVDLAPEFSQYASGRQLK